MDEDGKVPSSALSVPVCSGQVVHSITGHSLRASNEEEGLLPQGRNGRRAGVGFALKERRDEKKRRYVPFSLDEFWQGTLANSSPSYRCTKNVRRSCCNVGYNGVPLSPVPPSRKPVPFHAPPPAIKNNKAISVAGLKKAKLTAAATPSLPNPETGSPSSRGEIENSLMFGGLIPNPRK